MALPVFNDDSKELVARTLLVGSKLCLGTSNTIAGMLTPGYRNYQEVPIVWGSYSEDDKAAFNIDNGVMYNTNPFYFPEADDETGQTTDGWGNIHYFGIRDSSGVIQYTGELSGDPINVKQDVQIHFNAGVFRITLGLTSREMT